jgi:hypothetical protein
MTNSSGSTRLTGGRLLVAAAFVLSGIAVACSEDAPTAPKEQVKTPTDIDRSAVLTALICHASIPERTVNCGQLGANANSTDAGGLPVRSNIIIGGQDVFVAVKSTNVNYDAGTGAFTFDVTVRNLIAQPMGTADTTGANAPDANGVRAFFASGPTVTSGTGSIAVVGDGVGTFTGASQPYYQYNAVLPQFAITSPKTWQLNMPATVTTFDFLLLIAAEVPRPSGYIDLQVSSLKPPTDKQTSFTVRNANGTIDPSAGPITWSVSDTTRATIDANGLVNPLRTGSVTIIAQVGTKVGKLTVFVQALRRVWLGATDTNWNVGTNWYPDGVKPEPTDTAVVPDTTTVSNFPVLTQNESIGGVEVLDLTPGGTIPSVGLQAFNLTASGDVITTNSASITNTSGTLFLSGSARTVAGTMPFLRVTGTYSLIGNVISRAPIRVDLGRLTSTAFRLQGTGF